MIATLNSKTQITLPGGIRELLKLEVGNKVDFTLQSDGSVTVAKSTGAGTASFAVLRGIMKWPARAYSVEEMNQAV